MALTDIVIRKAKAKDAAYRLCDGGGLYLWITPAGGRLWRWKYRFDGREKLMPSGAIQMSPCLWSESATAKHAKCWRPAQTRWLNAKSKRRQQRTPS